MKLALITSHSQNNQELFELTYPNHSEYCAQHAYTLIPHDEPYDPYLNVDCLLQHLHVYDVVVTMGVDLLIRHPEIPLTLFANEGITMCPEISGTLNADFIVYKRCQATFDILRSIALNQHAMEDAQQYINRLYKRGIGGIFSNDIMQIAAPSMNKEIDYGDRNVKDYFALHFHALGQRPDVGEKTKYVKDYLEHV